MGEAVADNLDDRAAAVQKAVADDLAQIEADAMKAQPGILDVLSVYGNCEPALRAVDQYLSIVNPPARRFTADNSTSAR